MKAKLLYPQKGLWYNRSMKNNDNYCVYKHTTPNGKVYIGITQQEPSARWQHDGAGYKNAGRFRYAIRKYGWGNIQHEILATGLSYDLASAAERKLIKRYDSRNPDKGYNVKPGGEAESGWSLSEAARDKIRQSKLGSNNPMFGKKLSAEHRARISRANVGTHKSEETLARMREAQSHRSEDTRKRLSDAQNKTPVLCVELNTVYPGASIAARETGASVSNIVACCKGRRRTTGGYHWNYAS